MIRSVIFDLFRISLYTQQNVEHFLLLNRLIQNIQENELKKSTFAISIHKGTWTHKGSIRSGKTVMVLARDENGNRHLKAMKWSIDIDAKNVSYIPFNDFRNELIYEHQTRCVIPVTGE